WEAPAVNVAPGDEHAELESLEREEQPLDDANRCACARRVEPREKREEQVGSAGDEDVTRPFGRQQHCRDCQGDEAHAASAGIVTLELTAARADETSSRRPSRCSSSAVQLPTQSPVLQ